MEQNNRDWIDAVRKTLREAEPPLQEGSWERLVRELPGTMPRKRLWMHQWPKYVAAAAAVLICIAAGDAFRRAYRHAEIEIPGGVTAWSGIGDKTPQTEPLFTTEAVSASVVGDREMAQVAAPGRVARLQEKTVLTAVQESVGGLTVNTEQPAESLFRDTLPAEPIEVEPLSEKRLQRQESRQQRSVAMVDPFAEPLPKRNGETLFGAKAGGALAFAGKGTGAAPGLMSVSFLGNKVASQMNVDFQECSYAHKQPLSFAFTVGKAFPHGLSLESGIAYTLLRSKVSVPYASGELGQSLHFIGVPVRLNWYWLNRGGFSLYLSGGGMAEKCISARFGEDKIKEKAVQFSAFAALGAQYRLGNHVGLYFEPEVSYYFTETTLRTSRTDSPVSFTLQLGVRLFY